MLSQTVLVKMMKARIHRAMVARADLQYEGSLAIDETLVDAAGFLPGEAVHVWNIQDGERLETYAIPAKRDSEEICLNGAAARRVQPGDFIIITSFCWMDEGAARSHRCTIVMVDEHNWPALVRRSIPIAV